MNVRDFEIRSYEEAEALLKGKARRKVCNNTVLRQSGVSETIEVYLHDRVIVAWRPNRLYLYSCGYRTVTTKDRMNRCIPREYRVYQENHEWKVCFRFGDEKQPNRVVPFTEGMNLMTAFE